MPGLVGKVSRLLGKGEKKGRVSSSHHDGSAVAECLIALLVCLDLFHDDSPLMAVPLKIRNAMIGDQLLHCALWCSAVHPFLFLFVLARVFRGVYSAKFCTKFLFWLDCDPTVILINVHIL